MERLFSSHGITNIMKVVCFFFCVICLQLFGVKTSKYDDRNNTHHLDGNSTLELKECRHKFRAVLNSEANVTYLSCHLITNVFNRARIEKAVCLAESLLAINCKDDTDCHYYDKNTHCHRADCVELGLFGDYLNNTANISLTVCAASTANVRRNVFRLVVILIIVLVVALVCMKTFQWIAPIFEVFWEERSERRRRGGTANEREGSEEQTALTYPIDKPTAIVSAQNYCDKDPPPPYSNPPSYREVIGNGLPDTNS